MFVPGSVRASRDGIQLVEALSESWMRVGSNFWMITFCFDFCHYRAVFLLFLGIKLHFSQVKLLAECPKSSKEAIFWSYLGIISGINTAKPDAFKLNVSETSLSI